MEGTNHEHYVDNVEKCDYEENKEAHAKFAGNTSLISVVRIPYGFNNLLLHTHY
jgi:hypothetical protein